MVIYKSSVPYLLQFLDALAGLLKKAETHADSKKIDPQAYLSARLFPDMLPLTRQVQIACDFAKGAAARLSGTAVPSYPDEEKTFSELQARISKTADFIKSVSPENFAGAEQRHITLKVAGNDMTMTGEAYLNGFVLPNFYFHVTTAYNILRHNGIELGKFDYMGRK